MDQSIAKNEKMRLMHIPWIEDQSPLPPPESAHAKGSALAGLVAAGGGLSVERLKEAYRQGMFPWFSEGQPILWWSPDPRMVLKTENFKLRRSLRKTLQHFIADPNCEIRMNSDFSAVIHRCAETSRKGQSGTWIVKEMINAYEALHQAGYAHSVETWINQELVGGSTAYPLEMLFLVSPCFHYKQTLPKSHSRHLWLMHAPKDCHGLTASKILNTSHP